jgi:hypothetical protein
VVDETAPPRFASSTFRVKIAGKVWDSPTVVGRPLGRRDGNGSTVKKFLTNIRTGLPLGHDSEKWKPVFGKACLGLDLGIMPKQKDKTGV